jgi:hypothetical protein
MEGTLSKIGHKIEAKTKKGPINGNLLITVVEGRHLCDQEPKGKMDPYCIVKIGMQKKKTLPHKEGGIAPRWGDEMNFDLKGCDDKMLVKFVVKDKDFLIDDKIGRKEIPLPELAQMNGQWIQLINKKDKPCGEILVQVSFTGEGLTVTDRNLGGQENLSQPDQRTGMTDQHTTGTTGTTAGTTGMTNTGMTNQPLGGYKDYEDQSAPRKAGHQVEKGLKSGPINGDLTLNIIEGRDLVGKDFKGKIDPYCQVKIGKQKQKTQPHKEGGPIPKWNQKLNFDIKEGNEKLMVEFLVKDKDFLIDDKVGRAKFPLTELQQYDNEWIQLTNKKDKNCGAIRVGVNFTGQGWQHHGRTHMQDQYAVGQGLAPHKESDPLHGDHGRVHGDRERVHGDHERVHGDRLHGNLLPDSSDRLHHGPADTTSHHHDQAGMTKDHTPSKYDSGVHRGIDIPAQDRMGQKDVTSQGVTSQQGQGQTQPQDPRVKPYYETSVPQE